MGVSGYRRACFAAGQDGSREAPQRQQGNAAWLRRPAEAQGSSFPCGVGWLVAAKVPLKAARGRLGTAVLAPDVPRQFATLDLRR